MYNIDKTSGKAVKDTLVTGNPKFRNLSEDELTVIWYLCHHNSYIVKEGRQHSKLALEDIKKQFNINKFDFTPPVKDAIDYFNINCDGIAGKTVKNLQASLNNSNSIITTINKYITDKLEEFINSTDDKTSTISAELISNNNTLMKMAAEIKNIVTDLKNAENMLRLELVQKELAEGGNVVTASMKPHDI